jgi:ABC-2 type transport system ATP-binding protein
MMSEKVLEVSHIRKAYQKRDVLKDVSFSLGPGDAVALVGPNGAGKTTLIRILAGLVVPEEGSVSLFGSSNGRELRLARQRVGFIIDSAYGYDSMTVQQNLILRAELYGKPDKKYIRELREELRLTDEYHIASRQQLKLLSLGQKGRYALAAALVHKPKLLILDEPLVGIDKENVNIVSDLLDRLRAEGVAMLLSGHVAEQLRRICTHALLLENGIMRGPVPMEEVAEEAGE